MSRPGRRLQSHHSHLRRGNNAAQKIISHALVHLDEQRIVGTNPVTQWTNRGRGGTAYDLDVVVGTSANISTLDTGVAFLNGVSGSYFSTPDTGTFVDLDIRSRIAPDLWIPASEGTIMSQYLTSGDQLSWWFALENSTGTLRIYLSANGSTAVLKTSTIATGFTDGTVHWVRVTLDADNGSSGYDVTFYTSNDDVADSNNVSWTQLGDVVTTSTAITIHNSTGDIEVGTRNAGVNSQFLGKILKSEAYSTIGGSVDVVDFNAADASVNSSTWTSSGSGGETWTINGDAFVNASGHTGIYSRGSVGFETTAGTDIDSPFTAFIVMKPTLAAPAADTFLFDARTTAGSSVRVFADCSNSDKWTLDAGGTPIALSQNYDANLRVFTIQQNGDGTSVLTVSDVGSVTGNSGTENLDFGSLMKTLSDDLQIQGLFLEVLFYEFAMVATQVTEMQRFLEEKYGT